MNPDRIDFKREDFDPLEALRRPGVRPPIPHARPMDHILQFRRHLPKSHPMSLTVEEIDRGKKDSTAKSSQRRERSGASETDVIARMMDKLSVGPFGWLGDCVRDGRLVRIVTRHKRGIRGEAIGKIVAFDKHLNMVLRDVNETYHVRLMEEKQCKDGGTASRPVLEKRRRKLPNVFLTGKSIVMVNDAVTMR